MKKFITAILVITLAACGGEATLEQKKQNLEKLKDQFTELEAKIKTLEKDIADSDSSAVNAVTENGIAVEVNQLSPMRFDHFIEVNGVVEAEKNITLSPETGGHIKQILVKDGDRVSAGQLIAVLNTDVLQKSISEVQNGLDLATTVYTRQQKLWDQKIGSEIQLLQAKSNKESMEKKMETLQAQIAMATIKAPVAGVIDVVYQKFGELAGPGIPLAQLVNLEKMMVKADVSEAYAGIVKERDTVEVLFPAFNYTIKAPIDRISNIINPGNRSFKVQVNLNNKDNMLKPNYVATMKIKDFSAVNALVVPAIVVSRDARGEFVYTAEEVEGKLTAKKTYITTGKSNNGKTMVTEGLKEGQKVIIAGYNEVANGNEIRIVNAQPEQKAN